MELCCYSSALTFICARTNVLFLMFSFSAVSNLCTTSALSQAGIPSETDPVSDEALTRLDLSDYQLQPASEPEDQIDPDIHARELEQLLAEDLEQQEVPATTPRTPNFEGTISHERFTVMLRHITSGYDFLRIQFGHWLSDEQISDYLSALLRDTNSAKYGISARNDVDSRGKERPQTTWKDLDSFNRVLNEPYHQFDHLRSFATCEQPSRKVFQVSRFYPTTNVVYVPSDVVLHRCDQYSGCCSDNHRMCVPAEKRAVRQSFYVADVLPSSGAKRVRIDPLRMWTRLYFINHTRCQCEAEEVSLVTLSTNKNHSKAEERQFHCIPCPEPFSNRYSDQTCSCDCFEGQTDCLHVKRGRKALDGTEIKCIERKECQESLCAEGKFDKTSGFYPKSKKHRKKFTDDQQKGLQ